MTVAAEIVATAGDFSRFESPDKLVFYVGLNPSVRQSGGLPATHGRISEQGRAWGRAMLVEAADAANHTPGPLHAFFERVKAAGIADRHCGSDPKTVGDLLAHDPRLARLRVLSAVSGPREDPYTRAACGSAGAPGGGPAGTAAAYNLRNRERALGEQAKTAYNHLTRH